MNQLKLHEYQQRGIEFILARRQAYLAVDLGLGKTAITLKALSYINRPALVIAPLRVIYNTWPEEIEKWTPHLSYTILHGRYKDENLSHNVDIYLLNYDGLKWFYKAATAKGRSLRRMCLVLDESSFVKSHKTLRFKTLNKLNPLFNAYRIALSATPAPNGYQDLWSQYYLLDRGESLGKNFFQFRGTHFNYSGPPIYKTTIKSGHTQHIQRRIRTRTFRLEADDYLNLPPYNINRINVDLPPKQQHQYKRLEKDFFLELENEGITAYNAASLSMKLRQYLQGGLYTDQGDGSYVVAHYEKLRALQELVESSSGQPVLCAIQFKFELAMIRSKFKNVPVIAGGTNAEDSRRYISAWNRGELPLLLCHPASLGHGVNLQAGGHIICWYALTWSLEHYLQLNGRLRRQGQKNAVVAHHMIVKGTMDEVVLDAISRKDATQKSLLDSLKQKLRSYIDD